MLLSTVVAPARRRAVAWLAVIGSAAFIGGCATAPPPPPLGPPPQVDLARYMGDWYVISSIPTWLETDAHDAVESYRPRDDGRLDTDFTYRRGSFTAPLERLASIATVVDRRSNAVWTTQFIWPIQADYRILWIDPAHSQVVVGREKRDYVWIMARTPEIAPADYQRLVAVVSAAGYDTSKLRKVPQQPLGAR